MSHQVNDKWIESSYEIFIIETLENDEFNSFIQENYFTDQELWITKEYGESPEGAYDRVFQELLNWDFEPTVVDPIGAAKNYVIQRKS